MRYLVSLDSLDFLVDGIHTLDNRRPEISFDYAGQGQAGNDYSEEDFNYAGADDLGDGHGFAS